MAGTLAHKYKTMAYKYRRSYLPLWWLLVWKICKLWWNLICLVLPLVVYLKKIIAQTTLSIRFFGHEMAQRVKSLTTRTVDLSLSPRTHTVEGEDWFLQVALWPLHMCYNTWVTPLKETVVLYCPLEMLEKPLKIHQHGCPKKTWTRTTSIDRLTWNGKAQEASTLDEEL